MNKELDGLKARIEQAIAKHNTKPELVTIDFWANCCDCIEIKPVEIAVFIRSYALQLARGIEADIAPNRCWVFFDGKLLNDNANTTEIQAD